MQGGNAVSEMKHDFDLNGAAEQGATSLDLKILAEQPGSARGSDLETNPAVRQLQLTSNQLFRAASELKRTNHFQSMILDNINQGVVVVDEYSQLVAWNEVFLKLYDMNRKAIHKGMHVRDFAALFGDSGGAAGQASCNSTLFDLPAGEYFDRLANGTTIEMRVSKRDTGGLIATYTDVTQHIETQKRIEHQRELLGLQVHELQALGKSLDEARGRAIASDQQKSRFLAMISHDIRTPMSAVISTLELLSDPNSQAEAKRLREVALSSSRQMLYLLADIIEVSRSDGWNFAIQKEVVAISDVLEATADAWRPLAEQRGLSLSLALGDTLPRHVETDAKRLRQVIDNLVSNAVKFTAVGSLSISAATVSIDLTPFLRVAVTDTGRGIGEAEQHRLFQEFSRISSQGELAAEGTGLGLAICKRIIESMGGRMGLESKPSVGSTFWLEVPCFAATVAAEQPHPIQTSRPLTGAKGRQPRVLVADDVKSNRLILSMMLEKLGCRVTTAADGQEALELISDNDFDAVILDDLMPNLRGGEVAQRIRAMPSDKRNIPVLGATASTGEQEVSALREAGMDWVFAKPLSADQLREQLGRLLI